MSTRASLKRAIAAQPGWLVRTLKADIFAREVRPQWDAWGNETTKFNSASVREPELKPAISSIASLQAA